MFDFFDQPREMHTHAHGSYRSDDINLQIDRFLLVHEGDEALMAFDSNFLDSSTTDSGLGLATVLQFVAVCCHLLYFVAVCCYRLEYTRFLYN